MEEKFYFKDYLQFCGVLILGAMFAYGFVFLAANLLEYINPDSRKYTADSTWRMTVGTLTEHTYASRGYRSTFTYNFDNKTYYDIPAYMGIDGKGITIGDKFILKVDTKDPTIFMRKEWCPVFTEDEVVAETEGIILDIDYLKGMELLPIFSRPPLDTMCSYKVEYQYKVNNVTYSREQYLSPYLDSLWVKIRTGDKCNVKYWLENPQRSIIFFNTNPQ